jgi:hypothetical protein
VSSIADRPTAQRIALVLVHNVWSGGAMPVVVTLVGWLIFAKGLLLLFLPPETLGRLFGQMQYAEHYYLFLAPALVIGLYLTWAGFTRAVIQPKGLLCRAHSNQLQ